MGIERDGPFKVGDRVELEGRQDGDKYSGTVVAGKVGSRQCAKLDKYDDGDGPNGSFSIGGDITATLISPSTEPQAQEETRMQAYEWVIWDVDENGVRLSIAGESEELMPFKSTENAKLWAWQEFATTGQDPDHYEVEVHPFGG